MSNYIIIKFRILYGGLSPDKFENVSVLTFKSDESFL